MSINLNDSEKLKMESRTPEIRPEEIIKGDVLGAGSFGNVWRGTCRGKQVAIKELTAELDEKTIKEFIKECEILMVLRHSNIVTFMGACVERDSLAIVTELLDGDLETFIKDNSKDGKKVSLVQKLKMMRDVAQGMAWLHNSNPQIIHRDLKPKNILLDNHMNVKICDFGLSLMKQKNENINTRAGSFIWMAPEALLRKPHNEKVDVYSFGIVCWQLLVMNPQPFKEYLEQGSLEIFTEAVCVRGERPSLTGQPKKVKKFIQRLWDSDPELRPDFESIISELNNVMLDLTLIDPDAINFWKFSFEGKTEVPFEDFFSNLCGHLGIDLDLNETKDIQKRKCMEVLSSVTDVHNQKIVPLEKFGLLLKWFGPLTFKTKTIVDKIFEIVSEPWFHGEVSREALSHLEDNYKGKKDHFLVRFSLSEPIEQHPFTITMYTSTECKNYHLTFDLSTGDYSVSFKDKKKEVVTVSDPDIHALINFKLKKPLRLKTPIKSNLAQIIFGTIQDISYQSMN